MSSTLPSTPHADDDRHRRAVLVLLLTTYPALLTIDEVRRAVAADESFPERDAVDRAVRDLGCAGMVHRVDGFVVLSQPAVQTAALLEQA